MVCDRTVSHCTDTWGVLAIDPAQSAKNSDDDSMLVKHRKNGSVLYRQRKGTLFSEAETLG